MSSFRNISAIRFQMILQEIIILSVVKTVKYLNVIVKSNFLLIMMMIGIILYFIKKYIILFLNDE